MNSSPLYLEKPRVQELLTPILKYKWVILAVFVIVVTLVTIWNFKATPIYRASVQILIEHANPKVVSFEEVFGRNLQEAEYYRTQHKLLESRTLVERIVDAMNLSVAKGFGVPRDEEEKEEVVSKLMEGAIQSLRRLVVKDSGPRGETAKTTPLTPRERAVKSLMGRLSVEPVRLTRLVVVHYEDVDPQAAARVANMLVKIYIQMYLEFRFSATKEAADWLGKEINKVRDNLRKAEQALQNYKVQENFVSFEERQNLLVQKLSELSTAVTKARTERIEVEVLAKQAQNANGDVDALSALPDVSKNPIYLSLKQAYLELLRDHSELSKRYREQHPRILRIRSRLNETKRKLAEETRGISENIITRYRVALAREKSLAQSLEEQKQEALRLNQMEIQYQVLKREVDTNRKLYDEILKRTKETNFLEGLNTSNIRIVDPAEVPKLPIRPRRMRNILIAMVSSLLFAAILVFVLEHFDSRIHTSQEVEAITHAPAVGFIPAFKKLGGRWKRLRSTRMDGPGDDLIGEHFREIRSMVAFRMGNPQIKVIQVTSCIPREGKTLVSVYLAAAFASAGKNVLLIDGDFHRRGILQWFRTLRANRNPKLGFSQVLLGEADLRESIWKSTRPGLSILPAGGSHRSEVSDKIFEPVHVKSVIDTLREEYDCVIVDSPPLLAVSDSLIWSRCVDGVVFVLDALQVTTPMLQQAVAKLTELKSPIVGTIINRMKRYHHRYYYGYYRKYGYYRT